MKNLNTLKKLTKIFYLGLYVVFYLFLTLAVAAYFAGDSIGKVNLYGLENVDVTAKGIMIYTVLWLLLFYIFILAIKELRLAVPLITKENPFPLAVSIHFYNAGKYLIIVGVGQLVFNIIAPLLLLSQLKITIDQATVAGLFLVVIGLFFLFFSEAFKNAHSLQEENNLTV